jgi:hypothetical protein
VTDFIPLLFSRLLVYRFDASTSSYITNLLATPAFLAVTSMSRSDTIELFLFPSLSPKPVLLRDARAKGIVTALAVDAGGSKFYLR